MKAAALLKSDAIIIAILPVAVVYYKSQQNRMRTAVSSERL